MEQKVVKSAARIIHILEYFDEVRRACSVVDVADHHGWPHSSTSILMRSLVTLGYLHYDAGSRSYIPSVRVSLLGDWVHDTVFKNGQLKRLMQHLNDETGETVVLAAQNGLHSQYLRVLPGTSVLRMHLPNGILRPLLSSGTGHMLLSQVDDGTIRKFVRRYNADADIHQHVKVELLLDEIRGVREKGYAMSLNQVTPHSGLIAMLLPTSPGEKPLVVGIGGFSDRLVACERRYVEAMRTAVRQYFGS